MRDGAASGTFELTGATGHAARAVVLDDDRTLDDRRSRFSDEFQPYDVHLYKLVGG